MAAEARIPQLTADASLQRYEDLLRATTAIAGYRDIQTFRQRFAEELLRFVAFDYVLVLILDPETQSPRWRMFHTPGRTEEIQVPEFALHETPSGWVYANQAPLVIHDWPRETRYPRLREYLEQYGIRSSCSLPLTTVHRRLGVFSIGVSHPDAYSTDEVQFLSLIADHLALAIDNAWNLEASREVQAKLEDKKNRLELALELTNRLVSNLEFRDLLREVSGSVRRTRLWSLSFVMRMANIVLHWERIVSEISEGRWVTRQSDTPYLRPSFAMRAIARRVGSNPRLLSLGT